MRVADKMNFDQVKDHLMRNRSDLARVQTQAATQKRVNKPSDDPLSATRVLVKKSELANIEQFVRNINYGKSFLEMADQSLSEVGEVLMRAKELAIGQANDPGSNLLSRKVVASEIAQIHSQIAQISNRKMGDRFLFGGYRTTAPPFDIEGNYKGDQGEMLVQINTEAYLSLNVPGNAIFLGEDLSQDGMVKPQRKQPRTVEEFVSDKEKMDEKRQQEAQPEVPIRSLASLPDAEELDSKTIERLQFQNKGINVFGALRELEIGLRVGDKETIFQSLDNLDRALEQVTTTRSQLGSRVAVLDSSLDSLQKSNVEAKIQQSHLEDADIFATVNDLNKAQNSLTATLSTSSKLIQPSLLDFLK